jgi:ATP-dependent DNA helicase RecQ
VVAVLADHGKPMRPADLKDRITVSGVKRTRAVNLLEQAGMLTTDSAGRLRLVEPDLDARERIERAERLAEAHQRLIRSRIEMMREYAETTECRRRFLLGYFGEELAGPCGNCDTCTAGTASDESAGSAEFPPSSNVVHAEWGRGVVMTSEPDRVTALFDEVGYKTLSVAAIHENGVLTRE